MAKAKTNPKKELQAYVIETLTASLGKVKEGMSEKKFNRNIEKASKEIIAGFKVVKPKAVKIKKPTSVIPE